MNVVVALPTEKDGNIDLSRVYPQDFVMCVPVSYYRPACKDDVNSKRLAESRARERHLKAEMGEMGGIEKGTCRRTGGLAMIKNHVADQKGSPTRRKRDRFGVGGWTRVEKDTQSGDGKNVRK